MASAGHFGPFFRQQRQRLGLTLREFCRRNGLDPGNLSRLERGLLAPPQSTEILTAYAKALKLAPDSQDWLTLFDLAALETGRLPPHITSDPTALEKVQGTFRTLQRQSSRHYWTKAIDLELWADFLDARAQLPRLMRRLIHATVSSLQHIEFPADEGVQRPGWDGIVKTDRGNAFVPAGVSVWEMGVDRDPAKKAQKDFRTRTTNPLGLDPRQTTFIFVTPRKWTRKQEWCDKKRKLGKWKDVRVYDSANLEEWLERAQGVDVWIARLLGRRPEGITDIEDYWTNLSALTMPSLRPEVFLTSREEEIKSIETWLKGPPTALAFESASPSEVMDFLAAYTISQTDTERDRIASRVVIVDTLEAWPVLCLAPTSLLLIPRPHLAIEAEMIAEAVHQGHYVLLSSSRIAGPSTTTQQLSRLYRHELEPALVASGLTEEKAQQLAREAGGSLTILKRRLSRFPSTSQPVWSKAPIAGEIIPILLVGGWDDTNTEDQRILAKLAGRSYDEVLSIAHRLLTGEEPPLLRLLTHWSLVSHSDAWLFLAPFITRRQLDLFEEVAIKVLSEEDPCYDLPSDERWRAAVHGKLPRYSDQLRTGIAETLALLGVTSHLHLIQDTNDPARRAERVVRSILQNGATVKRWASLSSLLPTLAEAAPEAFLDAVEADLQSKKPQLPGLLVDDTDPLFSSCPHAGLLWALETLAWNSSLLTRVSLVLARLAQIDKGGRWANRPITSLKEIFLPWFPQTAASPEQRIEVLKVLTRRVPDIGWRLLLALLPTFHSTSGDTARPHWRDWVLTWSPNVTNREHLQQVEACADLLVTIVGTDTERWLQVIEHFENFPPSAQNRLISDLQNLDVTTLDIATRKRMTDGLRDKINKHRSFPNARRVLSAEKLDTLEEIKKRFVPQDAIARHTWLFHDRPQLINDLADSWKQREERLFQLRQSALREIFHEAGMKGVLALTDVAPDSAAVGFVLGKSQLVEDDFIILPKLLASTNKQITVFALGYGQGRFNNVGWEWIERLNLNLWTPEQAGLFLAHVPQFERKTWDLVQCLGAPVAAAYWSQAFGLCIGATTEDVEYGVTMLLQYKRPALALRLLERAIHTGEQISSRLLLDTLEAGLKLQEQDNSDGALLQHTTYEIQALFNRLQSDATVDMQWLAGLEWGYLRLLDGHNASPATLFRLLRTEPQVFVDLLCLIFRSDKEVPESTAVPTEEQKIRAQNAYRLLMKWTQEGALPGLQANGKTVNENELRAWVTEARRLSAERGRLTVCDTRVGEMLARSPAESDGTWPCIPIRDAIEDVDSPELSNGFEIGILNKRGVVVKSPLTGGNQERSLAQQYASYAEACSIEWPTTAKALRRVARHYEEDAHREDEEAKARSLR